MQQSNFLKFDELIFKAQCSISIPLLIILCLVTFLQVISRYVLNSPLYWSEELSRYLFVWLTFFGIGIAAHRRSEMSVGFFVNLCSKLVSTVIEITVTALVIVFLFIAIYEGVTLAVESHNISSIALELPWSYIYISVPLGFSLLLLQYISRLLQLVIKLKASTTDKINV